MDKLVQSECGSANPLMQLAQHAVTDQRFQQQLRPHAPPSGAGAVTTAPQSFKMADLAQHLPLQTAQSETRLQNTQAPHSISIQHRSQGYAPPINSHFAPSLAMQRFTSETQQRFAQQNVPLNAPAHYKTASEFLTEIEKGLAELSDFTDEASILNVNVPTDAQETKVDSTTHVVPEEVESPRATVQKFTERLINDFHYHVQRNVEDLTETDAVEFWQNMESEWANLATQQPDTHPWLADYEETDNQQYKTYQFEEENPLADSVDNAFDEGLKRLREGDIPTAALLFELAVQREPERVEAWQYLGTTQAENEQDPKAIAALRRCLALDPANRIAHMALAVSYTNEGLQRLAYESLLEWLRHSEAYADLATPATFDAAAPPTRPTSFATRHTSRDRELLTEVKSALLAAEQRSAGGAPDADLQTALGIHYNLANDYDAAADAFQRALRTKPSDALLWNKLGATLANGAKSDSAIGAYSRALQLSPGFVRCRYNLGIAHLNLGSHAEAARNLVECLTLQEKSAGQAARQAGATSDSVWSTLRMTASMMGRSDLYDAVASKRVNDVRRIVNEQA